MNKIIKIEGNEIYIGTDEQTIIKAPISAVNYADPQINDEVNVFQDGETIIVSQVEKNLATGVQVNVQQGNTIVAKEKSLNKHVFVWVGAFLFGGLGVDRFMRGQVGLGIVKLLFGWLTLGIWALIDFIIGLVKVYGQAFGQEENVLFVNGKYAR